MTKKPFDDTNWREEFKAYTSDSRELELLENGPHSLAQSWRMQAMYNKWKKIRGNEAPAPPNVSSSFKEFFPITNDARL